MEKDKNIEVLENIPFVLKPDKILKSMDLHGSSRRFAENVEELIEMVTPLARPKAMYKVSCVGEKGTDSVEIDGVTFNSHLIRINLDKVKTVFPFVATCGQEVEAIEVPARDILRRHCLEAIKLALMASASMFMQKHLTARYGLDELSYMSPGEIESWPVTQQKELFTVLGDVEDLIGVKLTEGGLMTPIKSRSGLHWATGVKFVSCLICTQKRCTGRQAAFNAEMAEQYQKGG